MLRYRGLNAFGFKVGARHKLLAPDSMHRERDRARRTEAQNCALAHSLDECSNIIISTQKDSMLLDIGAETLSFRNVLTVFPAGDFVFSKGKRRFSVGKKPGSQRINRFARVKKNAFFEVFACEGPKRRLFPAPKY